MTDARGNPVGTANPAALAHAETALWRTMSFFDTPLADLDAAAAADPAWALPPLMKAGFLLTLTEPALLPEARSEINAAQALLDASAHARGPAGEREAAHLAALRACAAGDWPAACAGWGAVIERHPRDALALQWAHLFDFHRGDAAALRQRPAQALPHWPADDPLRPYVLAMHAFGLEECGEFAQAEALGREAAEGGVAKARVPWATHAVAHVMEMQGRFSEGARWLQDRRADWAGEGAVGNGFANHHWWHLGLFQLEAMDTAAALALYDQRLGSAHCAATLQRLDGAALLWRLRLLGLDVGPRWHDIASGWDLSPAAASHSPFNDLHALLVLLGQHREADAEALIGAVERRGGDLARRVTLPLLRGMLDAGCGCWARALRTLVPLRADLHRIGGSHAQRDVVEQTLLAAAIGSGEHALGREWLAQRQRRGDGGSKIAASADTPLTAHWRGRLGRR